MPDRIGIRAEVERQVRDYFPHHVDGCEELERFASGMLEAKPWRGRAMGSSAADPLIAMESARSLKTYRAAVDGALGGFGPQAAMLNRALFEGMATTCWATANPELAAKRFRDHQRHNKALWSKRYTTHRVIDQPLDDIPDQAEMRVLDRQFGKWGEKLWCGLAVPELVDAIEGQWEQPQELRGFFALAHAANNETQHTTVRSLMTPVLANSSDVLRVDAGPSLQFVQQALYASLWIYAHMLRTTAYHFEIDGREKVMPLFARLRTPCEPIPAEDVKRAGRNDPCPCGSSKKFKHCHGR